MAQLCRLPEPVPRPSFQRRNAAFDSLRPQSFAVHKLFNQRSCRVRPHQSTMPQTNVLQSILSADRGRTPIAGTFWSTSTAL